MNKNQLEVHPLGFFLPPNTKLLMLGSFPPPQQRWSMDFFYPNIQNDMWRILGYIFYSDKDYFLESPRKFSERKCKEFCSCIGLGRSDTSKRKCIGQVLRNCYSHRFEKDIRTDSLVQGNCCYRAKSHGYVAKRHFRVHDRCGTGCR